ncbi:AraC family transcriptional regulator [Paenibacillus sp. LS1]|uniref:AraC family transcriptional regulator n=1 Tax=Paenibacillus sp. LS1 TaxID=2992120 RepID=UPI00222F1171|nr:AraC family transcriptional regulator [Paenibacillus sp. LS1]MCW3795373.1 AraC family transcriptional regulator [Paenibacillus sp. LS1]
MDWEAHIERWSRTAVRLLDIRHYRAEHGTVPAHYVSHTNFFLIITHGEARVSISGEVYQTRSSYILHGGADAELSIVPLGQDFACYLILYTAECASLVDRESFQVTYGFAPYAVLPVQEKCEAMNRLWQEPASIDKLQAQSVFLPLVYEVMRQQIKTSAKKESGRPNIVTEAIHYIHDHYSEPITAEELAKRYHCSASYLSRLFKNQIGLGPIEYLIHMRVHKSKQYLLRSEARIQEIASNVGYADVYYFSRLFKKHTGLSPLQFRAEHHQKIQVQYNPLRGLESSIVTLNSGSHNENETYYQRIREGDTSMFRFSRPAFGAMMLLCSSLLLSACQTSSTPGAAASQPASSDTTTAVTTDSAATETRMYKHLKGETEIPVNPQRVVSFYHLGELMALGVKPVGTTTYILDNPHISDKTGITDVGVPPDAEKILSLQPDLIVTTPTFAELTEGGYEALSKIAPTIVIEQNNEPIKDIEMFGDILGKQEEAKQWNEKFTAKIAEYKAKISPYVRADETFSILNVRPDALFVYGDTNMGGNIIYKYLGLKPAAKVESDVIHGETWEISTEVIPEFIGDRLFLAVNEGAEDKLKDVQKLIDASPAGKAGHVYSINFDQFLPSDPIAVEKQLDIITDLIVGDGK